VLAIIVALTGCSRAAATGSAPARTASPAGSAGSPVALTGDLQALLAQRSTAVLGRDLTGWLAMVDASDPRFVAEQRATFEALRQLPFTRWHYQLGTPLPAATAGAFSAHVQLAYRLAGDGRDISRDELLRFVRTTSGWRLAAEQSGATQPADLWDLGPIAVSRGSRSLVIGAAGRGPELAVLASELDAAAATVDAVWGTGWPRTVVALVPQDLSAMARVLGPEHSAGLDQLAAVTTGEFDVRTASGPLPRPTADRLVINADDFAGFGSIGRAVVLTHETTHLATRASSPQSPPLWLQEGFADYVAYRGSGLSRQAIASDLLDRVRAGHLPGGLPAADEFDASPGPAGPAYEGSWLAVDLIARLRGPAAVLRFYREAAGSAAGGSAAGTVDGRLRRAFSDVLGCDQGSFVTRWRSDLRALATGR
jgi:hypothetical protein